VSIRFFPLDPSSLSLDLKIDHSPANTQGRTTLMFWSGDRIAHVSVWSDGLMAHVQRGLGFSEDRPQPRPTTVRVL
jgi:hypothetical protein